DVPYTGFTSLARSADVVRLIGAEIDRANGDLSRAEQIKTFRILPKALDPEQEGEPITPTRKVKRDVMYERFKSLVEDMYDDREQRLIAESAAKIGQVLVSPRRNSMLRRTLAAVFAAAALVCPAGAQDAYLIGVTGAMTGPAAGTNGPPIEGLRLYVDRLNAAGGINGKKI